MRCSVITPVGPGHKELLKDCKISVDQAADFHRGRFTDISHITIDDTNGHIGRSAARNQGVKDAVNAGANWLFFLDADDVLLLTAFASVNEFVKSHTAIWGAIYGLKKGCLIPNIRANHLPGPNRSTIS